MEPAVTMSHIDEAILHPKQNTIAALKVLRQLKAQNERYMAGKEAPKKSMDNSTCKV